MDILVIPRPYLIKMDKRVPLPRYGQVDPGTNLDQNYGGLVHSSVIKYVLQKSTSCWLSILFTCKTFGALFLMLPFIIGSFFNDTELLEIYTFHFRFFTMLLLQFWNGILTLSSTQVGQQDISVWRWSLIKNPSQWAFLFLFNFLCTYSECFADSKKYCEYYGL